MYEEHTCRAGNLKLQCPRPLDRSLRCTCHGLYELNLLLDFLLMRHLPCQVTLVLNFLLFSARCQGYVYCMKHFRFYF